MKFSFDSQSERGVRRGGKGNINTSTSLLTRRRNGQAGSGKPENLRDAVE
jgi:hypothetical protein